MTVVATRIRARIHDWNPAADRPTPPAPPGWKALAGLLAGSGVLHFALPRSYEAIVPRALGNPTPWVQVSGVAELVCAAGLAIPRTRRLAGYASAALFVAVYPANLDMTRRGLRSSRLSPARKAILVGRLPLQVPLVVRALRLARVK